MPPVMIVIAPQAILAAAALVALGAGGQLVWRSERARAWILGLWRRISR